MEKIITINNRKFGVYEYGIEDGIVVFYCHGFPGSRLDGLIFNFDIEAKKLGLRIIAIDRPGIGNSDFQSNRKIKDWVIDLKNIADYLNIDKFSILGISGGSPYALAVASEIPDKLHTVSIVSGMGPFKYKESQSGTAMQIPKLNSLLRRIIVWFMKLGITQNAEKFKDKIGASLSSSDSLYLSSTNRLDQIVTAFQEALKQGLNGYLHEAILYKNDWGFDIKDLKPLVNLWHGSDDKNVSLSLAKRVASEIPNCKATIIENEGHFSLTGKYLSDVLIEIKNNHVS